MCMWRIETIPYHNFIFLHEQQPAGMHPSMNHCPKKMPIYGWNICHYQFHSSLEFSEMTWFLLEVYFGITRSTIWRWSQRRWSQRTLWLIIGTSVGPFEDIEGVQEEIKMNYMMFWLRRIFFHNFQKSCSKLLKFIPSVIIHLSFISSNCGQ